MKDFVSGALARYRRNPGLGTRHLALESRAGQEHFASPAGERRICPGAGPPAALPPGPHRAGPGAAAVVRGCGRTRPCARRAGMLGRPRHLSAGGDRPVRPQAGQPRALHAAGPAGGLLSRVRHYRFRSGEGPGTLPSVHGRHSPTGWGGGRSEPLSGDVPGPSRWRRISSPCSSWAGSASVSSGTTRDWCGVITRCCGGRPWPIQGLGRRFSGVSLLRLPWACRRGTAPARVAAEAAALATITAAFETALAAGSPVEASAELTAAFFRYGPVIVPDGRCAP